MCPPTFGSILVPVDSSSQCNIVDSPILFQPQHVGCDNHSQAAYLIFVTDTRTVSVEKKSVMWRNFKFLYMTDEEKSEISFIMCTIYGILLHFTLFCCKKFCFLRFTLFFEKSVCRNLRAFVWRKIEPKIVLVEKKDKYQVWSHVMTT